MAEWQGNPEVDGSRQDVCMGRGHLGARLALQLSSTGSACVGSLPSLGLISVMGIMKVAILTVCSLYGGRRWSGLCKALEKPCCVTFIIIIIWSYYCYKPKESKQKPGLLPTRQDHLAHASW